MRYQEELQAENAKVQERYALAMERIAQIALEQDNIALPYRSYFQKTAAFLLLLKKLQESFTKGEAKEWDLDKWKAVNQDLYADLLPSKDVEQGYNCSYANPAYAEEKLGKYGKVLCFLYTELRGCIAYIYENRLFDVTIGLELFIEIFNLMETEHSHTPQEMQQAIYYYISDYCDITIPQRTRELLDPDLNFATNLIMQSDLSDLRYLYQYGEYISENELQVASFLNQMSQEEIDAMARTYTEGYKKGFAIAKIDLSKKKTVNVRFPIGFERMVKAAILQFRAMGLEPAIYRTGVSSIHKRVNKTGYFGTSVNPQYDFDHRMDQGLYLDRPLMERRLAMLRVAYEQFADLASVYAGPAVIETFGQAQEELESKSQAIALSKKQQKVWVEYQNEAGMLTNQYIPSDQYSFTIIAYPIPEIGVDFAEIFAETVAVNTLDPSKYEKIQQCLIDALDQGQYVTIKGKGTNQTDLKVQLQEISEPAKQTGFENCLADVNIPVGEVFTSPKLEGTQGRLHVHSVYLNGLHYQDLDLQFQDGEVVAYTCKNFESEEKNKALIRDNVLYQHQTLPMGEFAIGTNTTAYAMGKKYGISGKLPILIAEKTGPHFALGDTCYSMSEDNQVYNPDGKEMIAKENSYSLLRHEKPEEAYFHCHTDITIPYEELEEIAVYTKAGEKIALIQDGRFCLPGTEKLNLPLGE